MVVCLSLMTPPMPEQTHTNKTTPTNERTLLVTLTAQALGSLGLGVSILAIWIHWFVPSSKAATPSVVERPPSNRHRRRSYSVRIPTHPPMNKIAPMTINGQNNVTYSSRRVYFKDSPSSERSPPLKQDASFQPLPEDSVRELESSLQTHLTSKADDESITESEPSSRRSSLSLHFSKKIYPFGAKSREQSEPSPILRTSSLQMETRHVRKLSVNFVPPWSSRRKSVDTNAQVASGSRPPVPLNSDGLDSLSTDYIQSPTPLTPYFSLKPIRRLSSPIPRPRTQPYEAPYFALPPIGASPPTFELRKSPPMLQEALINSARQNSTEDNRGRMVNSRPKERTLPKRRSASEGWNTGRRVQGNLDRGT